MSNRQSIRLKGYDYSKAGLYFLTICSQNKIKLFGDIVKNKMQLNIAGNMIDRIWQDMPNQHQDIKLHSYTIMPNHFHSIIEITVGADSISAQTRNIRPNIQPDPNIYTNPTQNTNDYANMDDSGTNGGIGIKRADMESAPTGVVTVFDVVQTFKRYTTIEYIKMVKQNILPPFNKKIWQRNYWEHIIRDENEYNRIAQYIVDNPMKWKNDKLNDGDGNIAKEAGCIND